MATAGIDDPRLRNRILVGLLLGTTAGLLANTLWGASPILGLILDHVAQPVGQIFLRLLLMVVVPLVFATLVLGIVRLGAMQRVGGFAARTIVFFASTALCSALLGLLLANLVRPGGGINSATRAALLEGHAPQWSQTLEVASDSFGVDTLVNLVPRNPVEAAARGDLLALIVFTIVFGLALSRLPQPVAEPAVRVLEALSETITLMIGFAMRLAPFGVAALSFVASGRLGLAVLRPLGVYTAVVLLGLLFLLVVVFGVLARVLAAVPPSSFFQGARLPMLTAFSTASSSATLPTTLRVAREELGIGAETAGLVLPLGATLNMNGTALFQTLTVLFLAQAFGVELGWGAQAMVALLAALSAAAAAGIPSGAIPFLVVILESVGVPGESIALMLGVEPLLGMARTVPNVAGDLLAALVVERSYGGRA